MPQSYTKSPPPNIPESPIEKVLERLQGARKSGTGWKVKCPTHDDRTGSLSISLGKDGETVLLNCFARCDTESILGAIGLEMRDLFPPKVAPHQSGSADQPKPKVAATYDYVKGGKLIFQVVRFEPKSFRQRRPDGKGGWVWNLQGVERCLYHHDEVVASGDMIVVVEGEKDADRLRSLGLTATTAAGGASKWRREYTVALAGREVVILPDNDEPGRAHAAEVAAELATAGGTVKVVDLPGLPDKGDVSDWLELGFSDVDLVELIREMPVWEPSSPAGTKMPNDDPVKNDGHLRRLSEDLATLGTLLEDVEPERIHFLSRGRFAAGKLTMIDGDPGLGKSTVLTDWAARITRGLPLPDGEPAEPRGVVILSAEDGLADTIAPRAAAAGADLSRILAITDIPGGGLPTIPDHIPVIEHAVRRMDAALLIVDPLVAYLSEGYNANRDQDVRRALAPLAAMAERTGVAVALVRHLNKMAGSNPLYRGGGSIGLIGAARFGLLFARDPEDDEKCVIAGTKANLSRLATSLAYRLDGTAGDVAKVAWLGESSLSAGKLLAGQEDERERGALDDARDFLRDLLREGPHPVKTINAAARDAGVTDRTLRRARETLNVQAVKEGFGKEGHWVWKLPDDDTPPKVTTPSNMANDGHLSTQNPPKMTNETPKAPKVANDSNWANADILGDVLLVGGQPGADGYTR